MTSISQGADHVYDIIVIGGGITGAGVARDAALRGLSTLLLEKGDYASGVSSKTTRLVHGGLRYLANFELDLVAESLRERAVLRHHCPYLVTPMPILIPIYRGDPHGRAAISVGIHVYEMLSREKDIPHYFTAGRERTLALEPRLEQEGLKGSALFYDHQIIQPERLVIENVISAREAGARVSNYALVERFEETEDQVRVTVKEVPSGAAWMVRGRIVINAGGPWADQVRKAGGINRTRIIHPTKGIHLVLPKLSDQSLFVASKDGRMFFIIPLDRWSLIGTTDTAYKGDLDEVHADASDVAYLLGESRRILPGLDIRRENILYTYAGIRPLAYSGERESKISRKHRVIHEGRTGRIITIAGGKYTTYRNMAEDAVNAASRKLGVRLACGTQAMPLAGSLPVRLDEYLQHEVPRLEEKYESNTGTVDHLIRCYGSRAERVLRLAKEEPDLSEAISPDSRDIYAQIVYGIREEGAKTLCDVVLRRMHLGITSRRGEPQIERIAAVAGRELDWSADESRERVEEFRNELKKEKRF